MTTILFADRVQETTNTSGTGTITLNGAPAGYQSFASGIGNGNTTYYCILSGDGISWETGLGTVSTIGASYSLIRSVIASSNSKALVSLSGTSTVFCDAPAFNLQTHVLNVATTNTSTSITASTIYYIGFNTVILDTDNIAGTAVNLSASLLSATPQGITVPASWNGHTAVISANMVMAGSTNAVLCAGVSRSGTVVVMAQNCNTAGSTNAGRNATTIPVVLATNDIIFMAVYSSGTTTLANPALGAYSTASTANNWLGVHLVG